MILNTRTRFHAAADIHTIGMDPANGLTDVFDAQTTRQNQFFSIESVEPFPGESGTRSAISRRPRIQQIKVRWKLLHGFERFFFLHSKRLNDLHRPAPAILPALLTVEL